MEGANGGSAAPSNGGGLGCSARDQRSRAAPRDTVVFLSASSLLGGAQISLASLMQAMPDVRRVLVAPPNGPLIERLRDARAFDEHIVVDGRLEHGQMRARWSTARQLGRWLVRNRRRTRAIHANGDSEATYLFPLLPFLRVPIVIWYHSRSLSPWTWRLRPIWRFYRNRITWAPVSQTSLEELRAAGVTDGENAVVVGNPIDPASVAPLTQRTRPGNPLVVGYLGFENPVKGILLLPGIARGLRGLPVSLLCVTKEWPAESNTPEVNQALDELRAMPREVRFGPRDHDVRNIYAEIDVLLVPSLSESFCRIAAEAMANGIPVVASDLPALREVCGEDAARFFPVGDAAKAAEQLRGLLDSPETYRDLAKKGTRRATVMVPANVARQFEGLYG